jgi:hypothetical protein
VNTILNKLNRWTKRLQENPGGSDAPDDSASHEALPSPHAGHIDEEKGNFNPVAAPTRTGTDDAKTLVVPLLGERAWQKPQRTAVQQHASTILPTSTSAEGARGKKKVNWLTDKNMLPYILPKAHVHVFSVDLGNVNVKLQPQCDSLTAQCRQRTNQWSSSASRVCRSRIRNCSGPVQSLLPTC